MTSQNRSSEQGSIHAFGVFLIGLALTLFVTAALLGVKAIWTVGPDAGRWGGTAGVAALSGLVALLVGGIMSEES